jgi:hypothetical protein
VTKAHIALLVSIAALVLSCGGASGQLAGYERCIADDEPNRARTGVVEEYGGEVRWDGRGSSRPPLFTVAEQRTNCELMIKVTRQNGASYENGPFRWAIHFRGRKTPEQLVYMASIGERRSVIVHDGRVSEPYDNIVFEPRYSSNGKHVGYVGRRGETEIVVVDGQQQLRHTGIERVFKRRSDLHMSSFDVLDDGRAVTFVAMKDDKVRVYVGGEPHPIAFGDVPEQQIQKSPNGKRFAYRARLGFRWVLVVDGAVIDHPGTGTKLSWSEDGSRYGFVVSGARVIPGPGEPPHPAEGYVLDGVFYPLQGMSRIEHRHGHWILTRANPRRIIIRGAATPTEAPTADQYEPKRTTYLRQATRMQIGESLGPAFDAIRMNSIKIENGVVSYEGERNKKVIKVVNNVITAQ